MQVLILPGGISTPGGLGRASGPSEHGEAGEGRSPRPTEFESLPLSSRALLAPDGSRGGGSSALRRSTIDHQRSTGSGAGHRGRRQRNSPTDCEGHDAPGGVRHGSRAVGRQGGFGRAAAPGPGVRPAGRRHCDLRLTTEPGIVGPGTRAAASRPSTRRTRDGLPSLGPPDCAMRRGPRIEGSPQVEDGASGTGPRGA